MGKENNEEEQRIDDDVVVVVVEVLVGLEKYIRIRTHIHNRISHIL
jgi:hypothetical protein